MVNYRGCSIIVSSFNKYNYKSSRFNYVRYTFEINIRFLNSFIKIFNFINRKRRNGSWILNDILTVKNPIDVYLRVIIQALIIGWLIGGI